MPTVCRVCLIGGGNVTLCSLEDVRLQDVYTKLTSTQFYSEDGRPNVICSFCRQNLLKCWNLSEMARRSEKMFSNLLFKGLEVTHETIESLNLGIKQHLSVTPIRFIGLDYERPKNSSAIRIKDEPLMVKEEETVQVDELVDNYSADLDIISEECLKSALIVEETSNNGHFGIENSIEIDIEQQNLAKDTDKLLSDKEQSQNEKDVVHSNNSKAYCCDICSKSFAVRSRLVSHIQLSHSQEQQCKTFDKKLIDSHCRRPKSVHTRCKPHACSICDKQYKQKHHLVAHMRIHTGVKPYACSICVKQYKQKHHLVAHMRIHTGVKPYACSICDKQFYEKSDLVKHLRTHTGVRPYACSICDKQFNEKCSLVRHMRTHTGEKPYACSICDKQFNNKSNLVTHMRIHTGVKPYACSICDKQFNVKFTLVTHMRTHTGEKPYACSISDKQFNEKCSLVRHMRTHTGEKPYACSICDKQFNNKFNLVTHMRIHTGEKPYVCSICDKQYKQKHHLVMHMRIHTGEKPYACSICDKQFNEKCSLVRHMRTHTGVKLYVCSTCDKKFNHKTSLVRHMRVHTGLKPLCQIYNSLNKMVVRCSNYYVCTNHCIVPNLWYKCNNVP